MSEDRRAVIGGVPVYTSHSASDRFLGCERSWWFRYVQGLPDKPGPAAIEGDLAHKRLEHYYETGNADILAESERAMLPLLPAPGPGVIGHGAGLKLVGVKLGDIPIVGAFDLLDERGPIARITDFKFKGRSKFGTFEAGDWRQLVTYAHAYSLAHPEAKEIELQHIHSLRKGEGRPKADSGCVRVPLDEVNRQWHSLADSVAPRLREVAAAGSAREVQANPRHCQKFGKKCVYWEQCPLTAGQRIVASQRPAWGKGEEMGLLSAKMKAAAEGAGAPPEAVVPVPQASTPAPAAAAPAPVQAPQEAVPAREFQVGATYELDDGSPAILIEANGKIGRFHVRKGTAQASFRDGLLSKVGKLLETAPEVQPIQDSTPVPVASAPTPTAPPEGEEKRGRGRPALTPEEKAARAAAKREKAASESTLDPSKVTMKFGERTISQGVTEPEPSGLFLYIGCHPSGVATQGLHEYVSGLEAELLRDTEETYLPSVIMSTHKALDFGKWKGALAAQALETPPPPGRYYVDPTDDKLMVVAHALTTKCAPGFPVRR